MKKVLFLMFLLFLIGLGTANVKAQVRIGGNTPPSAAAVLDLNATDATNNGTGGFTLPRVSLTALSGTGANLNGVAPMTGMLVYNTNATLGVGIYFWNGSIWNKIDDAIGNELTDTIAGGGLDKTGSGTAVSPWKVGIKTAAGNLGMSLISTGSGVRWGYSIAGDSTHYINIARNPNVAATWTKVADTTITMSIPPRTSLQISFANRQWTDMCYLTLANMNQASSQVNSGSVQYLTNLSSVAATASFYMRCYRPSA